MYCINISETETGTRDVESLRKFALEETVNAATKAQLDEDAEL